MLLGPYQAGDLHLTVPHPSPPCVLPLQALGFCPVVGLRQWRAQIGSGGPLRLAVSLDQGSHLYMVLSFLFSTWSCLLSFQEWGCLQNPELPSFRVSLPHHVFVSNSFMKTLRITPILKNSHNSPGMLSDRHLAEVSQLVGCTSGFQTFKSFKKAALVFFHGTILPHNC